MPFRADREQLAQGVGAGDFFVLVATGKAEFVGQRWIKGYVVPQPDVLPGGRQLGFPAVTMALRIDPVAGPVGLATRPDVGRKTQAQAHGAGLAGAQLHCDGNALRYRGRRRGIDPHALEIAARLQGIVEFGNQLGIVGGVGLERHHALQQGLVERGVAGETYLAQAIAWAAVIDQFDVGNAGLGINCQALAHKTPAEETVARSLVLDQPFGVFVMPVVEHFT
ncbi:hypothetical protein D9M71_340450 [compost metagenome]